MDKKKKIIIISIICAIVLLAGVLVFAKIKNNQSKNEIINYYTITFDSLGGNKISSQKVEEGNYISKPTNPKKEGYTFLYWKYSGKEYNFKTKVTSNLTLIAEWKEKEEIFTLKFDTDGGNKITSQEFSKTKKITKPSDPTKEGYTFKGWYLDNKEFDWNSTVEKDITLVAKWEKKVTSSNNGSTSNGGSVTPVTPTPTPTPTPEPEPTPVVKTYKVVATKVDAYSPDYNLTVYEDGNLISVSNIKYSDGTDLGFTVGGSDISGESSFIVVLSNGEQVTASLEVR